MKKRDHRLNSGERPYRCYAPVCKSWSALIKLGLFCLCIQLGGCASVYVLSAEDQRSVTAGEKTVVLIRIHCEIDNSTGKPFGTSAWIGEPYVALGIGSFNTIGEPRRVPHYFFSEDSRGAGWTYFVLHPGIYYLAALGPRSDAQNQELREAPRWQIDIPENTALIYAGTLHLSGRTDGSFLLGGKVVKPSDNEEFVVEDESDFAKTLLAETLKQGGDVRTMLMRRWKTGEPIVIRSRGPDSRK